MCTGFTAFKMKVCIQLHNQHILPLWAIQNQFHSSSSLTFLSKIHLLLCFHHVLLRLSLCLSECFPITVFLQPHPPLNHPSHTPIVSESLPFPCPTNTTWPAAAILICRSLCIILTAHLLVVLRFRRFSGKTCSERSSLRLSSHALCAWN